MEMTMPHLNEAFAADFTYRAASLGSFAPRPTIAGVLLGLLAGPGNTLASPVTRLWVRESTAHAPSQVEISTMVAPAAELITRIKHGWQLNMTELAELMGVQRPTLYNWLNGKTSPDSKLQKQLQSLAAAAADWKQATAGSNWDFLLDYSGPRADEVTLREVLGRPDVSTSEIRDLIHSRLEQYQAACVQAREILGEPTPVKGDPIRESTRKLNKRWTENARRLHRARNSSH
jgi:transcriptional regulator with XRE-family HTH domain